MESFHSGPPHTKLHISTGLELSTFSSPFTSCRERTLMSPVHAVGVLFAILFFISKHPRTNFIPNTKNKLVALIFIFTLKLPRFKCRLHHGWVCISTPQQEMASAEERQTHDYCRQLPAEEEEMGGSQGSACFAPFILPN